MSSRMKGRRLLITAGPTREPIDPVRYLSNASSGRMGYALAEEATTRGARVTLVTGPTERPLPRCARVIRVETAREMRRAVIATAPRKDAVISAAAVSDWRPARSSRSKLRKTRGKAPQSPFSLRLIPNPDILKDVSQAREKKGRRLPLLVGFALETGHVLSRARMKMKEKDLDLIVGNLPEAMGKNVARAFLLSRDGRLIRWPRLPKRAIARRILDALEEKLTAFPE